jgi:hypothetical protein
MLIVNKIPTSKLDSLLAVSRGHRQPCVFGFQSAATNQSGQSKASYPAVTLLESAETRNLPAGIVESVARAPGTGAAIGGVGGALAEYGIGHHLKNAQNERRYRVR